MSAAAGADAHFFDVLQHPAVRCYTMMHASARGLPVDIQQTPIENPTCCINENARVARRATGKRTHMLQ